MSSAVARVQTFEHFQEIELAEQAQADFFTVADRREQMKQSLMLEDIVKRMDKAETASLAQVANHETRLASLETTRNVIQGQGKLMLTLVGLVAALVGSGVHVLFDWLRPK